MFNAHDKFLVFITSDLLKFGIRNCECFLLQRSDTDLGLL